MSSTSVQALTLCDMSSDVLVYHGSTIEVAHPRLTEVGFPKDFGYGFYVTLYRQQAERWAKRKSRGKLGVVSEYILSKDYTSSRYLGFTSETQEWVEFVARCRAGFQPDLDIVEGPMADDTVWDFVSDYLAGRITLEEFSVHCKYRHPTHQIVFITDSAIQRCLTFNRSWVV